MSARRGGRRGVLLLLTAPDWIRTAWWGLVKAHVGPGVEIAQAAIVQGGPQILLSRRPPRRALTRRSW